MLWGQGLAISMTGSLPSSASMRVVARKGSTSLFRWQGAISTANGAISYGYKAFTWHHHAMGKGKLSNWLERRSNGLSSS